MRQGAGPPHPSEPQWGQINIRLADPDQAEHHVANQLGVTLTEAESAGLLDSWFFIRKPWWRFRYQPSSPEHASEAKQLIEHAARTMQKAGHLSHWTPSIYEPETHAFGGDSAMTAAHNLFHLDSRYFLTQLGPAGHPTPHNAAGRRETSLLLCAALMRAAGQDRYEQGDVWAKITRLRPAGNQASTDKWTTFKAATERLITADTSPGTTLRQAGSLQHANGWLTAFEHAGTTLRELAANGQLTRGLRAVLAHHVIFHWNRIGLPAQTQANIALAAKEAIFGEPPSKS